MSTGFEGLAQQAGALGQQAQGLRAAVDSGQMVMDPAAADRLAAFYESKAEDVALEASSAESYIARGAYGACQIGQAMDKKMADKIEHPEVGVIAILQKMDGILRNMAQTVKDAKREHQNTDDEQARNVHKIAGQI
jgi:hypothetical protein